jgi:hypothetical protein
MCILFTAITAFIRACIVDLIDLIILHTSLIDYGKCVVNPIGGIDSFKRSIFVYRLDCL